MNPQTEQNSALNQNQQSVNVTPEVKSHSSSKFPLFLVGGLVFVMIFVAGYKLLANTSTSPSQPSQSTLISPTLPTGLTANWETYTNTDYGFEIKYPSEWSKSEGVSQVFPDGDAVNFQITGETQKEGTEFYDGGQVTIAVPVKLLPNQSAANYLRYFHKNSLNDENNEFQLNKIGNVTWTTFHACGLGCYDYYHKEKDDKVYSIITTSGGSQKQRYDSQINQILSTFQFLN